MIASDDDDEIIPNTIIKIEQKAAAILFSPGPLDVDVKADNNDDKAAIKIPTESDDAVLEGKKEGITNGKKAKGNNKEACCLIF